MSDEYVAMHSYTTDGASPEDQSYLPLEKTEPPTTTTVTVMVHTPLTPLDPPEKGQ